MANAGGQDFLPFLKRGSPTKNAHRYSVGSIKVVFHLQLEIIEGIEAQVVVEAFLIVTMTAFYLAVMPRRSGPDRLMPDIQFLA